MLTDSTPFLVVDFEKLDESLLPRLVRFRHDEFQPDALRTLAEETVYLNAFTDAITNSLREPDADFVRYVANRSGIQRQFNARFLESITPIVKQAVSRSVSEMVVTGLSAKPPVIELAQPDAQNPMANLVDPNNSKIVTTYAERRLFEVVCEILGTDVDLSSKDTESYYSILYQGKTNRWLVRYFADRKQPTLNECVPMTDESRREFERAGLQLGSGNSIILPQSDYLMRISGIVLDALAHCQDDANFKRTVA